MAIINLKVFPYSRTAVTHAERGGFPFYCAIFTPSYKNLDILVQDTEMDRKSGAYHKVARISMKDLNQAYKVFEDVIGRFSTGVEYEFRFQIGEKMIGAHRTAYLNKKRIIEKED